MFPIKVLKTLHVLDNEITEPSTGLTLQSLLSSAAFQLLRWPSSIHQTYHQRDRKSSSININRVKGKTPTRPAADSSAEDQTILAFPPEQPDPKLKKLSPGSQRGVSGVIILRSVPAIPSSRYACSLFSSSSTSVSSFPSSSFPGRSSPSSRKRARAEGEHTKGQLRPHRIFGVRSLSCRGRVKKGLAEGTDTRHAHGELNRGRMGLVLFAMYSLFHKK